MVHLSPDSRLLASLVKQEQAYSNQLYTLLNASGTSLSALAVYASSSPPTISPVLKGVASAFSGADEALRNYGEALNDWIDQLRTIKSKEEQVANIGRDREILVTRLLKVSQKSKSPPPSLLHAAPDSSSNISFSSFNSKINAAQTELQACELQLAENERDLEKHRIHAIRQGLKLRCEALVHCGWVWGEMGRRALSMLEELNGVPMSANGHVPESLPRPTHEHDRDSILSSLTPSQSASQTGVMAHSAPLPSHEQPFRLDIPPPHLLSEHTAIPGPTLYTSREPEYGSSSSEDEGPVEVIENPRFQSASFLHRQRKVRTAPSTPARSSPVPFPSPSKAHGTSSDIGPPMVSMQGKSGHDRKGTSFFGSIALLFRTSMNSRSSPSQRWSTRTDHNVRRVRTAGEDSSEDEPRTGRLRKSKARPSPKDSVGPDNLTYMPAVPPFPLKNKTNSSTLGRSSVDNSTTNDHAPAPRVRANTLTLSTSRMPGEAQGQPLRTHRRRASMDGRWGLSDEASGASSPSPGSTSIWKMPKHSTASKASSLMSIVEGVSHSNQRDDDSTSRLEVVRAPGNEPLDLPLLVHHPPPLPSTASAPASLTQTSIAQKRASMPNPPMHKPPRDLPPAPEKKPLRSALRSPNRARSVSPSPGMSSPNGYIIVDERDQAGSATMSPLTLPGPALPALAFPPPTLRPSSISRPEIPSTILESPRQSIAIIDAVLQAGGQASTDGPRQSLESMGTDDTASISSYETVHEIPDDEVVELGASAPPPPAPPPVSEKVDGPPLLSEQQEAYLMPPPHASVSSPLPQPNGITSESLGVDNKHEMSSATSTETPTGATTMRRKSVRMSSLPPQVSATPPALDDEDEDRAPWGRSGAREHDEGWKTRISASGGAGAWDDSSSEDEMYKRARKALSRVEQRLEKKGR